MGRGLSRNSSTCSCKCDWICGTVVTCDDIRYTPESQVINPNTRINYYFIVFLILTITWLLLLVVIVVKCSMKCELKISSLLFE